MFLHVTDVNYIEAYRLRVEFNDGVVKEVDLLGELHGEVFEPLKDMKFFQQVRVNGETSTIEWPKRAPRDASEGVRTSVWDHSSASSS